MTEYYCKLCQRPIADTTMSREDIMQTIRSHFENSHSNLSSDEFGSHINEQ